MSKFDEFVNAVLNGARDLAVVVFNGLEDSAKDDAKAFLEKFEADLKRWTKLLAVEEITERAFADLVRLDHRIHRKGSVRRRRPEWAK